MATEKSTVKLIRQFKSFPNFLYFQKYDLNILRFTQVSLLMFTVIHYITFKQAGLLMYRKEFTKFVPEVKWIELDMPYFYFVSIHFPFVCYEISFHILSFYHSWLWQWFITHSFYLGAIICKIIIGLKFLHCIYLTLHY